MRIVAGQYRGRRLTSPKGEATRPTTDRVREALFSSLAAHTAPDLGGGSALDAFAGSGALGFEALSRGLSHITFIERDRAALNALKANAEALGATGSVSIVAGDTQLLSARGGIPGGPFALLLLDPPYRLDAGEVGKVIAALVARELLEDGALIVYEHAKGCSVEWPSGIAAMTTKRYGSTEIDIATYERGAGST